jgi:putative ABC transport system permease protein
MLSDLRFAFRQLAKAPGHSATVIATLALSIGACTAIYSVVDGVLLRPLPYPNAERIHHFGYTSPPPHQPGAWASSFDYYVWEQELTAYDFLAASITTDLNLATEVEPQRVPGLRVTARYFEVFGVKPVLGRTFLPEDDTPGRGQVIVLGHGFWLREFAGAPDVIGRTLSIHGEPHTVIGVAPRAFGENMPGFGDWRDHRADAWVPMAFPSRAKDRKTLDYAVGAQPKRGRTAGCATGWSLAKWGALSCCSRQPASSSEASHSSRTPIPASIPTTLS